MENIERTLNDWQSTLCKTLDISGLYSRNPVAHKWKVPYQNMALRETVAWRFVDLTQQSLHLHREGHALGARILHRSALETLSVLIYLNQLTRRVVAESLGFEEYLKTINVLFVGSRDQSTPQQAKNIITILEKCDTIYPGILKVYAVLSESAHPNYEGMRIGYSETDTTNLITTFSNRWASMYSGMHLAGLQSSMNVFEAEYNKEWAEAFEALEVWLEKNDAVLNKK